MHRARFSLLLLSALLFSSGCRPPARIPQAASAIPADKLVQTATHGARVDLDDYLGDSGSWTVVEFYADW